MENRVLSVSMVNAYIKSVIEKDGILASLCIRGELSNYKIYPSGHHYFTLKDEGGAIRCVMFRGNAMRLRFRPQDGMKVLTTGRITVYERDGAYQLNCTDIIPEGAGDLHVAFEQLKAKLAARGLFAQEHKKSIPRYPHTIAIITSSAGAALHDMLRILSRRYPLAQVKLLPVRVQGKEAPAEIAGAIAYVNRWNLADVIITGRGGGSLEDLWAFNEEIVANAIYQSEIPVISAVGHEPDVTISDYVADLRAATPSNAAELVAPDQIELRQSIGHLSQLLISAMRKAITDKKQTLIFFAEKRVLQRPENYLEDRRQELDLLQRRLSFAETSLLSNKKEYYVRLASGLDAMSPLKVLSRGYSVAKKPDGQILSKTDGITAGENFQLQLSDGLIYAKAEEVVKP